MNGSESAEESSRFTTPLLNSAAVSRDGSSLHHSSTAAAHTPTEEDVRWNLSSQLNISSKNTAFLEAAYDASSDQNSNVNEMDLPRQISVDAGAANNSPWKTDEVQYHNRSQLPPSSAAAVSAMAKRPGSAPPTVLRTKIELQHAYVHSKGQSESSDHTNCSQPAKDQWGWFEDVHEGETDGDDIDDSRHSTLGELSQSVHTVMDNKGKMLSWKKDDPMAVTAPTYVLEESKSSQTLWKHTAGNRPPQPVEERAFFEKLWAQNFERSQVDYQIPPDVLVAPTSFSLNPFADGNNFDTNSYAGQQDTVAHSETDTVGSIVTQADRIGFYGGNSTKARNVDDFGPYDHHHTTVNKKVKEDGTDDELTVVVRGDNVFGTTVSKSFSKTDEKKGKKVVTVSISVASYRVVQSKKHGKYAQFLVIYCEGTFRDTVGVWKRYSDFEKLSNLVSKGHESCTSAFAGINPLAITEDLHDHEVLPNAVTSWKLLKKRQRWFRCLDAGYLSLKAFLLERFLHDILFESTTPDILRDFAQQTRD
jgi:hypothetical protein